MRESAIVTYHGRLISATRGNPSSVEFDFDAVWRFKKQYGEGWNARYLNWVHVHPPGFGTSASSQDQLCAAALAAAFGHVDRFSIICFSNSKPDNIDGDMRRYYWSRVHKQLQPEPQLGDIGYYLEDRDAYILKTLSYGELWQPSESTASEPSVATSSSN